MPDFGGHLYPNLHGATPILVRELLISTTSGQIVNQTKVMIS